MGWRQRVDNGRQPSDENPDCNYRTHDVEREQGGELDADGSGQTKYRGGYSCGGMLTGGCYVLPAEGGTGVSSMQVTAAV